MEKQYDVVVWGATGFTGRLVVEYLWKQYGKDGQLKWAMAARNEEKLNQVAYEIGVEGVPVIIADSNDSDSLHAMCRQSRVICTTVGPYALYGTALVEACIANGCHYCDLAGEVQWMRRIIDEYQLAAEKAKVKIVHTCGFDSIPSDMGVFWLQKMAKEKHGKYCQHIKMRLKAAKGGFSGGTYASLTNVMVEMDKDTSIKKTLFNPYGLNPKGMQEGPDKPDLRSVKYDQDLQSWISPFIMSAINTKVVRRSNALAGFPYGKSFRYEEAVMTGGGIGGRMKSTASLLGLGLMTAAKPGTLMGKMMNKFLPDPGEGPDRQARENGFFYFIIWGKTENGDVLVGKVTGDKDPGYGSTSKMLGESAVCLAMDKLPDIYGILTPSTGMRDALLERLTENAGMAFTLQGDD